MTQKLTLNSSASMAMVGKGKTPASLAVLMPSADIVAKVGFGDLMGRGDTRMVRRKSA